MVHEGEMVFREDVVCGGEVLQGCGMVHGGIVFRVKWIVEVKW